MNRGNGGATVFLDAADPERNQKSRMSPFPLARTFDIAVLGATPAAYAAAYYLAKRRCDVVVVTAPSVPTECPLTDWAPRNLFQHARLPRSLARACGAAQFTTVCYHNSKLDAQAQSASRGTAGFFVHVPRMIEALKAETARAGVTFQALPESPAIRLEEDRVCLAGGRPIVARLLLIVHSTPTEVVAALAQPGRMPPPSPLVVAGLDVPLTSRHVGRRLQGALHVMELVEHTDLGIFFVLGSTLHLRVISSSKASGARAAELSNMVASLQSAGIVPGELALGRSRGSVWYPPAGAALELETHVAKRCLLAGTAGGFADSVTGQTLWPSVQSALLAAQTALAALKSRNTQESLMAYKTSWRRTLANNLRPPSTPLQMLLPLLFVNRRIVPRFTRTLLHGEGI